jgi:hypothetical protein
MEIQNTNTGLKIAELAILVESAKTFTENGRQTVTQCCKELYNLIEKDVYNAEKEWMLQGMYNDLCNGNFSEPFYCEQKKNTFKIVVEVYNTNVVPYL